MRILDMAIFIFIFNQAMIWVTYLNIPHVGDIQIGTNDAVWNVSYFETQTGKMQSELNKTSTIPVAGDVIQFFSESARMILASLRTLFDLTIGGAVFGPVIISNVVCGMAACGTIASPTALGFMIGLFATAMYAIMLFGILQYARGMNLKEAQ